MSNAISIGKKRTQRISVSFSKFISPFLRTVKKESSDDKIEEFVKMENIVMDLESDWG